MWAAITKLLSRITGYTAEYRIEIISPDRETTLYTKRVILKPFPIYPGMIFELFRDQEYYATVQQLIHPMDDVHVIIDFESIKFTEHTDDVNMYEYIRQCFFNNKWTIIGMSNKQDNKP